MSTSKIALLAEMIGEAEKQLASARRLIAELSGDEVSEIDSKDIVIQRSKSLSLPKIEEEGTKIIEGIFDGQNMIDGNGKNYPVPANYASKSKLVVGDQMKLTITEDGKFLYKQIGPVERRSVVGPLTYENGQYKVLADGKSYKILLASITFYRAEVGDEVSILLPEGADAEWGALDVVIPKVEE